jgi:hypothetical protein
MTESKLRSKYFKYRGPNTYKADAEGGAAGRIQRVRSQ